VHVAIGGTVVAEAASLVASTVAICTLSPNPNDGGPHQHSLVIDIACSRRWRGNRGHPLFGERHQLG
jgi:hypothetical protein